MISGNAVLDMVSAFRVVGGQVHQLRLDTASSAVKLPEENALVELTGMVVVAPLATPAIVPFRTPTTVDPLRRVIWTFPERTGRPEALRMLAVPAKRPPLSVSCRPRSDSPVAAGGLGAVLSGGGGAGAGDETGGAGVFTGCCGNGGGATAGGELGVTGAGGGAVFTGCCGNGGGAGVVTAAGGGRSTGGGGTTGCGGGGRTEDATGRGGSGAVSCGGSGGGAGVGDTPGGAVSSGTPGIGGAEVTGVLETGGGGVAVVVVVVARKWFWTMRPDTTMMARMTAPIAASRAARS